MNGSVLREMINNKLIFFSLPLGGSTCEKTSNTLNINSGIRNSFCIENSKFLQCSFLEIACLLTKMCNVDKNVTFSQYFVQCHIHSF